MGIINYQFISLTLSIALLSIEVRSTRSEILNCSDSDLIWYEIKSGQGANNVIIGQKIKLSRLDLTQYADLPATVPDAVVTNADFPKSGATQRIYKQNEARLVYGCTGSTFLCRVAFIKTASPSTYFQINFSRKLIIKDDGTGKSIQPIACIIYRNTI